MEQEIGVELWEEHLLNYDTNVRMTIIDVRCAVLM